MDFLPIRKFLSLKIKFSNLAKYELFLAPLWGAYAISLALSAICRPSSIVCHVCPPRYQINICSSCSWIVRQVLVAPPTSVIKLCIA